MDTIPRLIDYIEKSEIKIKEYEENGKTNEPFYEKLKNYRDGRKRLYDKLMKRKTTWGSFGKALDENNDACTSYGDEIKMEMVNGNELPSNQNKPEYFKYYKDLYISDKMIEDNHRRFLKVSNSYKTIKEPYTDHNGRTYNIYKTIPVEIEKYKGKFEVPKAAKECKTKRTLDDLFKEEETKTKNEPEVNVSNSKYVPPSIRKGDSKNEEEDRIRKLIIRNIPHDIMEDDIADIISTCGKLYDVRIHRDKYTGDSKGFAFIKCETHEIAKKIIETYDRKPIGHMIMRINFAEDRNKNKRHR